MEPRHFWGCRGDCHVTVKHEGVDHVLYAAEEVLHVEISVY